MYVCFPTVPFLIGDRELSYLCIKSVITSYRDNTSKTQSVLSAVLTPIGNCKPVGQLSHEKEKLFLFVYESASDPGPIVTFLAESALGEPSDKRFTFTFVTLLEKFLRKKFLDESPKCDFVKDACFLQQSLAILGPELCRTASGSFVATGCGQLPTRLCVSTLDLILVLIASFSVNAGRGIVVEEGNAPLLESSRNAYNLLCFFIGMQEKILGPTKPLYASGLLKAREFLAQNIVNIPRLAPFLCRYMSFSDRQDTSKRIVPEAQHIIGLIGNPKSSKSILGLICLCLLLGRSSNLRKTAKEVGYIVFSQMREVIAVDPDLGTQLVQIFLPLDNPLEEETAVVEPLLCLLDSGIISSSVMGLIGSLAVRHPEKVVGHVFSLLCSDVRTQREAGAKTLKSVLSNAGESRLLSGVLMDYAVASIPLTKSGECAINVLGAIGNPVCALTALAHYLGTQDETTRAEVENVIVSIMERAVSDKEPENRSWGAISFYADVMRAPKEQAAFTLGPTATPADLQKLHFPGKENNSEDLLRLAPKWCRELRGSVTVEAAAKVMAAPGDTVVVQFFRTLVPFFQPKDVQLQLVPFVAQKLGSQKKLSEEMLNSPCGKEQVTALLFERISSLLVLKMALGHCSEVLENEEIRGKLEGALLERMTSVLEFDEVRRVAAEVVACLKPSERAFKMVYDSFEPLFKSVMSDSVRDDDSQIVLRAVIYALASVIKGSCDESVLGTECTKLEEMLQALMEKKRELLAPALVGAICDCLGVILVKSNSRTQRIESAVDEITSECPKNEERCMLLSSVLTSVTKYLNSGTDEYVSLVVPKVIKKATVVPKDYLVNVILYALRIISCFCFCFCC